VSLHIYEPDNLNIWKPSVMKALTEITDRVNSRYTAEQIYHSILQKTKDKYLFALWLCVDTLRLRETHKSVVGMMALELAPDEMGEPVVCILYGWIEKGYRTKPFTLALPKIEAWAKTRNSNRIQSMTDRNSKSYERWIGRYGFNRRETIYEKSLN